MPLRSGQQRCHLLAALQPQLQPRPPAWRHATCLFCLQHCDGVNKACPKDEFKGAEFTCRPADGACDEAEVGGRVLPMGRA